MVAEFPADFFGSAYLLPLPLRLVDDKPCEFTEYLQMRRGVNDEEPEQRVSF